MSDLLDRLMARVEKTDTCWLWTGGRTGRGYGSFGVGGRTYAVHRLAYEQMVAPIPEGLTIDHLCRVKVCVNPAHLEPVTNIENILRSKARTHCPEGHPYDEQNKMFIASGAYRCRTCHNDRRRERRIAAGKTPRAIRTPRVESEGPSSEQSQPPTHPHREGVSNDH